VVVGAATKSVSCFSRFILLGKLSADKKKGMKHATSPLPFIGPPAFFL